MLLESTYALHKLLNELDMRVPMRGTKYMYQKRGTSVDMTTIVKLLASGLPKKHTFCARFYSQT